MPHPIPTGMTRKRIPQSHDIPKGFQLPAAVPGNNTHHPSHPHPESADESSVIPKKSLSLELSQGANSILDSLAPRLGITQRKGDGWNLGWGQRDTGPLGHQNLGLKRAEKSQFFCLGDHLELGNLEDFRKVSCFFIPFSLFSRFLSRFYPCSSFRADALIPSSSRFWILQVNSHLDDPRLLEPGKILLRSWMEMIPSGKATSSQTWIKLPLP